MFITILYVAIFIYMSYRMHKLQDANSRLRHEVDTRDEEIARLKMQYDDLRSRVLMGKSLDKDLEA